MSDRHDRLDRGQNFGAITATVAAGDLVINAADHAPRMVVPWHEHANPYLCVVMAGCLEVHARQALECGVGTLIAYPMVMLIPIASAAGPAGAFPRSEGSSGFSRARPFRFDA